jgi:thymidylate kinase
MTEDHFRELFPTVMPLNPLTLQHPLFYIGAAGFEDRAMALLDRWASQNIRIEQALGILYEPHGDPRNRVTEFKGKLEALCSSIKWMNYDRLDPQKFQEESKSALDLPESFHVLVDISGMSKFLIMVLLQVLTRLTNDVTIAYAEADIYHPTRDEFEKEKKELGATPDFLTSDVYTILRVTSLSSVSMQGYPILLLVFSTFNHNEVAALHNEVSPQLMILVDGNPHEDVDKWRLQAVVEVNRSIKENPDYNCISKEASTFDYISNVELLQEIYQEYCFTHKILLAPTGSKLQTIASFLFRQIHPDVQVVYPLTKASLISNATQNKRAAMLTISAKMLETILSFMEEAVSDVKGESNWLQKLKSKSRKMPKSLFRDFVRVTKILMAPPRPVIGKLIVITGIDKSGKETQAFNIEHRPEIISLYDYLIGSSFNVMKVALPSYKTTFGSLIASYLGKEDSSIKIVGDLSKDKAWLLWSLDRAQHNQQIEDWLGSDPKNIVLSKRWTETNIAYQKPLGIDERRILTFERNLAKADYTIVLDVPIEHVFERMKTSGEIPDRYETPKFLSLVSDVYGNLEGFYPFGKVIHVTGSGSLEEVNKRLIKSIADTNLAYSLQSIS